MRMGGVKTLEGSARAGAGADTTADVIGRGATACVFRPAIECDGSVSEYCKVSKIFRSKKNADSDWAMDQTIGAIDPTSRFSVKSFSKCDLLREHVPEVYFTEKCKRRSGEAGPVDNWDLPTYTQIIYEYAGISYANFVNRKPSLEQYVRAILPLFYGLQFFHARGITHRDISLANVAFNLQKNYFIFIDFGGGSSGRAATNADYKHDKQSLMGNFVRRFFFFWGSEDDSIFDDTFLEDKDEKEYFKSIALDTKCTFERVYEYARDRFDIVFDPSTGTFLS